MFHEIICANKMSYNSPKYQLLVYALINWIFQLDRTNKYLFMQRWKEEFDEMKARDTDLSGDHSINKSVQIYKGLWLKYFGGFCDMNTLEEWIVFTLILVIYKLII